MKTKTLAAGLALAFSIAGADTRTATVQGGRPVAKAIEFLEKFYGVPITYEDPPYVNSMEIADVTDKVRGGQSVGPRILVPRGGSLSFAYENVEPSQGSDAARLAVSTALSGFLASYQTSAGARFETVSGSIPLHVVPARFTNQLGQVQSLQPLLDIRVSLAGEPRSANKLVSDLCEALSRASGQTVVPGVAPYNLLASRQTSLSVSDVTARSVLDQLFAEIQAPLSWQLFYDPTLNWYVLNIHLVQPPAKEQ